MTPPAMLLYYPKYLQTFSPFGVTFANFTCLYVTDLKVYGPLSSSMGLLVLARNSLGLVSENR